MSFQADLAALVGQIDSARWPDEVQRLKGIRSLRDLEMLAQDGWISTGSRDPRLKLVRHGSGTFLVVKYEDGWSTRVAMQPMRG